MVDATRHKEEICWRTLCKDVHLFSEDTGNDPAVFELSVKPEDINEEGALLPILVKYLLVDNIGTPFPITYVSGGIIRVVDIFRTNQCPVSGELGFICKQVWKGRGLYLSAAKLQFLHPLASSNINKYNLDILWSNDPNTNRIPFADVMQPSISNYRLDILDADGNLFNPEFDYGQNPKFEVWQVTESGKHSRLPIDPQITRSLVDGLIDSVLWSSTGELISGFITISK